MTLRDSIGRDPEITPFVETAQQLVMGLHWVHQPIAALHDQRTLQWRHHGLGMLQAELSETLRIHLWHPKLVCSEMAWPRCVHDHRFDLTSAVLVGEVQDVHCRIARQEQGHCISADSLPVKVYEIEHAKNQDRWVAQGRSVAVSARQLFSGFLEECGREVHRAGTEYRIARRMFHTTRILKDLAITVVHRSHFDDRLARVCCAEGSDVTAISGIVRDESINHRILVNQVLYEAADALANLRT